MTEKELWAKIFPDENLRQAIQEDAKIQGYTIEEIAEDRANINTLCIAYSGIKDLTGVEHFACLERLYTSTNKIEDISPLSNLVNLKALDISNNNIKDVSPLAILLIWDCSIFQTRE